MMISASKCRPLNSIGRFRFMLAKAYQTVGTPLQHNPGYFRTEAKHLGRLDYAFEAIEQARGRALTDVLRVKPSSDQPAPARLSATERRISRLQIQIGNAANRAERRRLLNELHAVEQELNPLQATYEKTWLQVETRPATLEQIRTTLQPDEVLVQYVLGEPAFVLRRGSPR
jgi:hypothetical protein